MAYTPRKKHSPKSNRPYTITLELGGQQVEVYEALGTGGKRMMFVSTDLFDAILEETGHGKASQKAKT